MTDNPWLDIRNSAGHLLFRYNPWTNEVEFRKNGYSYDLIRLDEIRVKMGILEPARRNSETIVITVQERKM